MKTIKIQKKYSGFTLVELLVVAVIVGILLAIAIPNVIKARISANEANARKSLQALRDAEYEYFEGDLDNDNLRDFTDSIGNIITSGTLRCPTFSSGGQCTDLDSLIDSRFEEMVSVSGTDADCTDPFAGYCIKFDGTLLQIGEFTIPNALENDFGWLASPVSVNNTGRKDFASYADTRAIHCTLSTRETSEKGVFEARKPSPVC